MNYNRNVTPDDNLYRLYEDGGMWACNKCNDKGDKWYIKNTYVK
jgi:hypothetical protein